MSTLVGSVCPEAPGSRKNSAAPCLTGQTQVVGALNNFPAHRGTRVQVGVGKCEADPPRPDVGESVGAE